MRLVGLQRILSMQPDMFLLQRKSFFYIVEWYPDGNHCQREGCSMTEWEGMDPERDYIERIPEFSGKKSGLPRVREFLGLLGNPDREFQIFHVAGTNGKGSVCAFLTAMLKEAGISCGTFISPHLVEVRERFLINGEMVSREAFLRAFEETREAVRRWMAAGEAHPTYFEFLFYLGLVLFRNAGVSVLVLETGMGGLRDVTNVTERPLASVITSISFDHMDYLGHTISEIAGEKAGIIKTGVPLVYDASNPEAAQVIKRTAKEKNAPCLGIEAVPFSPADGGICFSVSYKGKKRSAFVPFSAPYQAMNASLAVGAMEASGLPVSEDQVFSGLRKAKWPARMEEILPEVYLDGAHNEDGIRAFLEAACLLKEQKKPKRVLLLFGAVADKEYGKMLRKVKEQLCPEWCILAQLAIYRAIPLEELLKTAKEILEPETRVLPAEDVGQAVSLLLKEKKPGELAFIAGSLYLAGEVKAYLDQKAGKEGL